MNEVVLLILIGIICWLLNFALGFIQIKNFNENYIEMRRKGRVVIGRKRGYLQAGTIILLNVDEEDTIFSCKIIQGISVLAKMKQFNGLEGKQINKLTQDDISQYRKLTRVAILNAIDNFNQFKKEEINEKEATEHLEGNFN
ncbi:transcriptional regulator GutM [Clostridium sp. 'White wine YQ']|uniref:transcriptional regulator GutM n=1 Tax=Clostridium sp. 'White wine YQ' TaxID=3027474 RepID=UPI0023673519|nr:transcriptional regulator GutM [Clostridium sp. 'White wine YQ']MDD7795211.1 transcriptional regulator GutM [Clostridium sp. 'White wine YQ']